MEVLSGQIASFDSLNSIVECSKIKKSAWIHLAQDVKGNRDMKGKKIKIELSFERKSISANPEESNVTCSSASTMRKST